MDEGQLFDPGPLPPSRAPMSPDRRRTLRQKALISQGIHPVTRLNLVGPPDTCGKCVHAVKNRHGYWKCDQSEMTRGPATDIRVSWPACELFERGAL